MEIIGIGCDLVSVKRVKKAAESEHFLKAVYTEGELAYCRERGRGEAESLAARFAAKEAVAKALGCGLSLKNMKEIEVQKNARQKPEILLSGYYARQAEKSGCVRLHLSLSHTAENALAYVVAEGERQ